MTNAAHAHDEHEARYREGHAAAWDRPLRDSELYDPALRDVYNFIDETKVRHLRPLLPASGVALEVGAGSGRLLIRLGRERPYRLVALDYAPYAIKAVRENLRRAALPGSALFADALALPLPDASVDLVLSGGLFYADIVPRKTSLYRWAERGRMAHQEHMAEGIFESDLPKRAWATVAREAGLRDVRIISAGVYPPYTRPGFEALLWRHPRLFRALDGTLVSDVLGFFYMLTGRK